MKYLPRSLPCTKLAHSLAIYSGTRSDKGGSMPSLHSCRSSTLGCLARRHSMYSPTNQKVNANAVLKQMTNYLVVKSLACRLTCFHQCPTTAVWRILYDLRLCREFLGLILHFPHYLFVVVPEADGVALEVRRHYLVRCAVIRPKHGEAVMQWLDVYNLPYKEDTHYNRLPGLVLKNRVRPAVPSRMTVAGAWLRAEETKTRDAHDLLYRH